MKKFEGKRTDNKGELTNNYKQFIATRIYGERELTGLNQKDFARAVGVSNQTFNNLEQGKGSLKIEYLYQIANYCGCDIGYLLGECEHRTYQTTDACKVTGLSEEAVNNLISIKEEWEELESAKSSKEIYNYPVLLLNRTDFIDFFISHSDEVSDIIEEIESKKEDIRVYKRSPVFEMLMYAYKKTNDRSTEKYSFDNTYTKFPSDYFVEELELCFLQHYEYGDYRYFEDREDRVFDESKYNLEQQREMFKEVLNNPFLELLNYKILEDDNATSRDFARESARIYNHFYQSMKDIENIDYERYQLRNAFEKLVDEYIEGESNGNDD